MKTNLSTRPLLVLFLFLLSFCSNTVSPEQEGISIEIKSQNQELSIEEKIEFILHNRTNSMLYLEFCGSNMTYIIEQKDEDEWIGYSGQADPLFRSKVTPHGHGSD